MNINIPKNVKYIIDTYYNNNYEAFMVGGCVRDSLLGLKPKDFDITTSALPKITEDLFSKTIPTGIKHGTVTVVIDKENFEEFLNKMRLLFAEIDLNIIVYKSEKVHYTTNLTDKFGKVMVWKV